MKIKVASIYSDNDPENSRRYVQWERYTLFSDGTVLFESAWEDSDWWGFSKDADNEINKWIEWSKVPIIVQSALRQNAIDEDKLPEFELAIPQ